MKWRSVLELFFPRQCAVCAVFDEDLCAACAAKLKLSSFSCIFCGHENNDGRTCLRCKSHFSLDGLCSAVSYHDPLAQTIVAAFKYRNHRGLAAMIAALMARDGGPPVPRKVFSNANRTSSESYHAPIQKTWRGTDSMLLPLPLAPQRQGERGYNQAALLAHELTKFTSIPLLDSSLLLKIRSTPQQAKAKSREERFEQIKNAFALRKEASTLIAGKRIILIDDVATSGATLNEAARVLKNGGASSVWGWVFAHG